MTLKTTLIRAALLLALLFPAAPSLADQGSLCLPTTGTVSGLTIVQDVNAALQALVTSNSGASSPANPCSGAPVTGQMWLDGSATPAHLRIYDGANFLDMGAVDAVSHIWTPPVGAGATTLASASTTNLGSVPQTLINISGTTTIASLGALPLGIVKVVKATGAFTLTYNATTLILPGAASITAVAGDTFLVVGLGGSNNLVAIYQKADGTPLVLAAGSIGTSQIAANAVTNAKLAQMATATLKGNASSSTANAADLSTTQARGLPGMAPKGHLYGLTLSNDSGTPASVIDVAAGEAANDNTASPTIMSLGSAITKSVTSTFTAGTGNGCWDTGSIATPSTVHFFEIAKADGSSADLLCSASATSPTLPATYTLSRRIGSDLYASSALLAFVQSGDDFLWNTSTAPADYASSGNRSKAALALTVPSGIRVRAILNVTMTASGGGGGVATFYDGANPNTPTIDHIDNPGTGTGTTSGTYLIYTNTSAQIQMSYAGGSTSVTVNTTGWTDTRGR